ncbi:MAG: polyprenyl synthetase family protein [Ancalomicrobiaceae bacterium]|nr:polyprenyl synthetase family protein [Ancalomicrobiaceae bacterium]
MNAPEFAQPMTADPTPSAFQARLAAAAARIETELQRRIDAEVRPGETARPERLVAAMRHATLDGGKRLRPFLVIESAAALGAVTEGAAGAGILSAAAAIELVHCYSLVHDDLPAMDDDDLRRGRPTTHRAFDEATAILAGDALLTYAFDILADTGAIGDAATRLALVAGLARAAGLGGMVGGQVFDLTAEGRYAADGRPLHLSAAEIRRLQAMKTGALLTFCCEAGAILAGTSRAERDMMRRFGRLIGEAFQMADDLIDVESLPEAAGKATGKDAARGKATLWASLGTAGMRAELDRLTAAAEATLAPLGASAATLVETARFIARRRF